MSKSNNPKDSQALLQSMLQRLKLQTGKEGQEILKTPSPAALASTWRQTGGRGESNDPNVNTSSVNGFQFAANSNSGPKGREIQQPSHCDVDRGIISLPSQKGSPDEDMGEKRVFGPARIPEITLTRREQQFPVKSLQNADATSLDSSDGKRASSGGSAVTRSVAGNEAAVTGLGHNQDQNQAFTTKAYTWSLKSTATSPQVESEENKMGNGDSEQSKDMQFVASSPKSTNSGSRRKQRSSENRSRRWTQKIKERWLDRQGSFGKKGKEQGGRMDQKSEQVPPQNQLLKGENMITPLIKEEERTYSSLDNSDPSKPPPAHTEDSSLDGRTRSYSDFEFGLGSFSLLEEIATGQEWAKFLNPNLSGPSASQRPTEEPQSQFKIPPNPYGTVQPAVISNQQGGGSNQWSLWHTKATPGKNTGMAQTSADVSLPVSMEVSEGKQQESVHKRADLLEPMDDGAVQPAVRSLGQQFTPPSYKQRADILDKSRVHPNRKRQHQSEKEAQRERSISAPSTTSSHAMDETEVSQHDISSNALKSPIPPSPSVFNPYAPVPRSVLKHSISQDSEASMETVTKRRRVEENRRVHFSEEVVAIELEEVDLDAIDSEDESGSEEDSVLEQEFEAAQAPVEEVLPVRRPALPAWMLALKKKKNKGRKNTK